MKNLPLLQIPNHEGYYVNSIGDVFTCWKLVRIRSGKGGTFSQLDETSPVQMKTYTDPDGYKRLTLQNKTTGKGKGRGVHQLVLEAHGYFRDKKNCVVRHLNGKRDDNRIENLKWGTPKQNSEDMAKHGTVSGHNNRNAKLTPEDVVFIRTCGLPTKDLMLKYGTGKSHICRVRRGDTYKNVPA